MKRICEVCGKEFDTEHNSKVCSKKCRDIKWLAASNCITPIEQIERGFCECKICGYIAGNLSRHLLNKHNLTKEEYCNEFNCSERDIITEYVHNSISEGQKNAIRNGVKTKFQTDNPGRCHGGTLSPFSRKFIKYQGLSEEEITKKINALQKNAKRKAIENNNINTRLEYYTSRGYSEEEAKQMLKERQNTSSLSKYIERYGEEEGTKKFNERQIKWQATLNAKSDEEKQRIYNLKIEGFKKAREMQSENGGHNLGYSKISQELFESICKDNRIKMLINDIYYATKGSKVNNEYELKLYSPDDNEKITIFMDFFVESLNKCIEFDGTYWHSSEESIEKDKKRDELLNSMGIKILRIKEKDYCKEPEKIVKKCIRWILKK